MKTFIFLFVFFLICEAFIDNYSDDRIKRSWKWSEWNKCSVTCGEGQSTRKKQCGADNECKKGKQVERRTCKMKPCPGTSEWAPWSPCPTYCGETAYRVRTAKNTNTKSLERREIQPCPYINCPIHGGWSAWTSLTSDIAVCALRIIHQSRNCTEPKPKHGGKECQGAMRRISRRLITCFPKVNGGWSKWTDWSRCSKRCNAGIQYRKRNCDNPKPKFGGAICSGNTKETRACNKQSCRLINGIWSKWTNWSPCSTHCNGDRKYRRRTCYYPRPDVIGLHCSGCSIETEACTTKMCESRMKMLKPPGFPFYPFGNEDNNPFDEDIEESLQSPENDIKVHGGWSNWMDWSPCSKSCNAGIQSRKRTCNNPTPNYGGKSCSGCSTEFQACNKQPCKSVDGGWSRWSHWTRCDAKCGIGKQQRLRSCNNPSPSNGGRYCDGNVFEMRECDSGRFCH